MKEIATGFAKFFESVYICLTSQIYISSQNSHFQKTEINWRSNIIYTINCFDCINCYVGQTKKYIEDDIHVQKYWVNKAIWGGTESALHRMFPTVLFANFTLLDTDSNLFQRLFLENYRTLTVNKLDVDDLNNIYISLMYCRNN